MITRASFETEFLADLNPDLIALIDPGLDRACVNSPLSFPDVDDELEDVEAEEEDEENVLA